MPVVKTIDDKRIIARLKSEGDKEALNLIKALQTHADNCREIMQTAVAKLQRLPMQEYNLLRQFREQHVRWGRLADIKYAAVRTQKYAVAARLRGYQKRVEDEIVRIDKEIRAINGQ
jgi:hypothetical protein